MTAVPRGRFRVRGVAVASRILYGVKLPTKRLDLILESTAEVLARIDALSPADRAEVSPEWLARLLAADEHDPWAHAFAIVDRGSGKSVGTCAFKGPPDSDGMVEIAYGVDPDQQGLGYATEAAEGLVAFAIGNDAVRLVRAHTLPSHGPSTRVLTKCGFTHVGEVDPEDGPVWRWERTVRP
jgi:ribosomal-protein-alanine N-acetyltransferase